MIDSLDVRHALFLVEHDRAALVEYLLASLRRLAAAGVDFGAITANTPHVVFDLLSGRSPVPLLSIVEGARRKHSDTGWCVWRCSARDSRWKNRSTATSSPGSIDVITPNAAERAWVHERYVGELLNDVILDATRRQFLSLVARLRTRTVSTGSSSAERVPAPPVRSANRQRSGTRYDRAARGRDRRAPPRNVTARWLV